MIGFIESFFIFLLWSSFPLPLLPFSLYSVSPSLFPTLFSLKHNFCTPIVQIRAIYGIVDRIKYRFLPPPLSRSSFLTLLIPVVNYSNWFMGISYSVDASPYQMTSRVASVIILLNVTALGVWNVLKECYTWGYKLEWEVKEEVV